MNALIPFFVKALKLILWGNLYHGEKNFSFFSLCPTTVVGSPLIMTPKDGRGREREGANSWDCLREKRRLFGVLIQAFAERSRILPWGKEKDFCEDLERESGLLPSPHQEKRSLIWRLFSLRDNNSSFFLVFFFFLQAHH